MSELISNGTVFQVASLLNECAVNIWLNYFQLSVKHCFIRGSVVRYIQLPSEEVDTQLLQDATRKEVLQNKKT